MKMKPRSEGELFLENFLSIQKIKFKPEQIIRNLQQDVFEYRVADFYLPQYKMYIEFQGLWNNTKDDRERYKEKMRAGTYLSATLWIYAIKAKNCYFYNLTKKDRDIATIIINVKTKIGKNVMEMLKTLAKVDDNKSVKFIDEDHLFIID